MRGNHTPGSARKNWKGGKSVHGLGYIMVLMPNHPRAHQSGYVLEHILVAEHALGHPLPLKAQVHHVNDNKAENRGFNLVICENQKYHALLHQRAVALAATGSVHSKKCVFCKQWNVGGIGSLTKGSGSNWYHTECWNTYQRNRLAPLRTVHRGPYRKRQDALTSSVRSPS